MDKPAGDANKILAKIKYFRCEMENQRISIDKNLNFKQIINNIVKNLPFKQIINLLNIFNITVKKSKPNFRKGYKTCSKII